METKPNPVTRQQKLIFCKAENRHSQTRKDREATRVRCYYEVANKKGVIERIPQEPIGEVKHYIPHQPVIREQAETTKIRIVYGRSAKQDVIHERLFKAWPVSAALTLLQSTARTVRKILYQWLL